MFMYIYIPSHRPHLPATAGIFLFIFVSVICIVRWKNSHLSFEE